MAVLSASLSDEMQIKQKICAESLISAVQSRTVLWNDTHKEYKNKNTTDKQWNEVSIAKIDLDGFEDFCINDKTRHTHFLIDL